MTAPCQHRRQRIAVLGGHRVQLCRDCGVLVAQIKVPPSREATPSGSIVAKLGRAKRATSVTPRCGR